MLQELQAGSSQGSPSPRSRAPNFWEAPPKQPHGLNESGHVATVSVVIMSDWEAPEGVLGSRGGPESPPKGF